MESEKYTSLKSLKELLPPWENSPKNPINQEVAMDALHFNQALIPQNRGREGPIQCPSLHYQSALRRKVDAERCHHCIVVLFIRSKEPQSFSPSA